MLAFVLWCAQSNTWQLALEAGDFRAAWEESAALPAGVERARAEASILYRAGDPGAALAAARRGLEQEPLQLELLFHAAGSSLWLGEAELARESVDELESALRAAPLEPGEREDWVGAAQSFRAQADVLAVNEAARRRALGTARAGALLLLGVALAALALVARGLGQPLAPQGKSSSPVS